MNGEIDMNEGALMENIVACSLASKDISLHYYDHKSKQELDFIIPDNGKIAVIEVKSGNDYKRHASLNAALRTYHEKISKAIVLCTSNLEKTDDIWYCPLYLTDFLM